MMKLDVRRAFAGVIISLIVFAVVFPVLFWLLSTRLDQLSGFRPLVSEGVGLILAAAAFVVGLFWIFWSYSWLLFVGHGSPVEAFGMALSPTKRLVTTGPYAFTRNPMLLGYLWILLGIAFFYRSVSGIILVLLIGLISVIYLKAFEEPELVRRFGSDYEHYREHVPMLLPAWRVYIRPETAEA